MACICIPGAEEVEDRSRYMPEAYWAHGPSSLVSSRPEGDPVSKTKVTVFKEMARLFFHSTHIYTYISLKIHEHMYMCVHSHDLEKGSKSATLLEHAFLEANCRNKSSSLRSQTLHMVLSLSWPQTGL